MSPFDELGKIGCRQTGEQDVVNANKDIAYLHTRRCTVVCAVHRPARDEFDHFPRPVRPRAYTNSQPALLRIARCCCRIVTSCLRLRGRGRKWRRAAPF
jgi:hypothetical protein